MKTIRVSTEVAEQLARKKGYGESYDDVLRRLLNIKEEMK